MQDEEVTKIDDRYKRLEKYNWGREVGWWWFG